MFPVKHSLSSLKADKPVVLATGCFDGVHLGHQKVIATAVEQARARGGEAWVYTFDPHPAKVFSPQTAPPLISAETCRLRQFESLGAAGVLKIPFDLTFARMEPEEFLSNLRETLPTLSGIVCGSDWSFGYKARGKFQTLEKFCTQHGITATAVHPVLHGGEKISSTHIRRIISAGNIPLAEKMLGRPFCIFGTVVKGRGIGRGLGFPTANIEPENELIPAPGIYAARTILGGKEIPSAVFIGKRTTFNDHEPVIESYLLDFNANLYGQAIEVRLVQKTREARSFPSREALIEQIGKDVTEIREMLTDGL
ncbi:MAG: riboflavin kinase / adenylyltransferase [Verrucomicrobiota bacterium]|jgi:riboflavin kinase/FMN adenylyltransferase|nr:riboflavin kinase / adenylyltransferase [Verrucomicrobiota bacterium]MDK2963308.1 riboflavin kinase / adenylyltransferase [Verrucomicrobiota bacterium]